MNVSVGVENRKRYNFDFNGRFKVLVPDSSGRFSAMQFPWIPKILSDVVD